MSPNYRILQEVVEDLDRLVYKILYILNDIFWKCNNKSIIYRNYIMDNEAGDIIKIYPGKYTRQDIIYTHNINEESKIEEIYTSQNSKVLNKTQKKVIILDLDETIGSFTDFYRLWTTINDYMKLSINKSISEFIPFYSLLDLYPEFLRHGILHILEFIYHKKTQGICSKIYLYTNNQIMINSEYSSPTKWVSNIVDYLTSKICGSKTNKLFDKLICAFKINRKIIEIKRTTNSKTHADFIKCTVLPKNTEICFIDDNYYSRMATERVYYIQPMPYIHYLDSNTIIQRFIDSSLFQNIPFPIQSGLTYELYDCFGNIGNQIIPKCQIERDIAISRKLIYYIREFFYLRIKKTKTRRLYPGLNPRTGTRRKY